MTPLIDLNSAREILVRWFPPWLEFLVDLDAKAGQLQFKPEMGHYLEANNHGSYPLLYERLPRQMEQARLAIERSAPADLVWPGTDISLATPEARGRFMIDCLSALDGLEQLVGPHLTVQEEAAAETVAADVGPEGLQALQPLLNALPSMFMAMFYEYVAVAVHGVSLSTLIQWAKAGNDEAFGKAVQIDGRILVVLPYFTKRYSQARLEGNKDFLRMVANKTDSLGYRGPIKQKGIWFVIALLDFFGLLETMSGEEMLDFCTEVGANDGDTPIEDVTNMLKRVATYKRYQKTGPMSTP